MQSSHLRQRSGSIANPMDKKEGMDSYKGLSSLGATLASTGAWSNLLNRKRRVLITAIIFTIITLWYMKCLAMDEPPSVSMEAAPVPLDILKLHPLPPEEQWQHPEDWNPRNEMWRDFKEENFSSTTAKFDSKHYHKYDPYTNNARDGATKFSAPVSCIGPRGKRMIHSEKDWVHGYWGQLKDFPKHTFGMYEELGLNQNVCVDRFGKNNPYGYNHSTTAPAVGSASDEEVDWDSIDWANLQQQCIQDNKARFDLAPRVRPEQPDYQPNSHESQEAQIATKRTAILIRGYSGQDWFSELRIMIRSLIMELAIGAGGEYEVFILYHVKDVDRPIDHLSQEEQQAIVNAKVPPEFRNITIPWNEAMWQRAYPRIPAQGQLVHYGQWFPVQWFQKLHPEFDFYMNWETDIRYTGHYYDLLDKSFQWAKKQKRLGLWERNARWYIPGYHHDYDTFSKHVESRYVQKPINQHPYGMIWGPYRPFPKKFNKWLGPYRQDYSQPFDPEAPKELNHEWGIGEDADLVTFNPIFNPRGTHYSVKEFYYNYDSRLDEDDGPSRRATIITFMRLSHRLLAMMEYDNTHPPVRHMASEQWPQSVALYHGLKTVFVPHPIWLSKKWPAQATNFVFQSGDEPYTMNRNPAIPKTGVGSGGIDSVFGLGREHNLFWLASYYYRGALSMPLYRWFYGQNVSMSNRNFESNMIMGGPEWEAKHGGTYCLPPMLLHPIKDMAEEDPYP